jgi:hypothetical protein
MTLQKCPIAGQVMASGLRRHEVVHRLILDATMDGPTRERSAQRLLLLTAAVASLGAGGGPSAKKEEPVSLNVPADQLA